MSNSVFMFRVDYFIGSSSSSFFSFFSSSSGSLTIANMISNFFTSNSNAFFLSLFNKAVLAPLVGLLRLGESLTHCIKPL